MKKLRNFMFVFLLLTGVICIAVGLLFNHYSSPVGGGKDPVTVVIGDGDKTIADTLKDADLIRSTTFFKIYLKLFKIDDKQFKKGTYTLNKEMSLKEIIDKIQEGTNYNPDEISITFKEGYNIRKFIFRKSIIWDI